MNDDTMETTIQSLLVIVKLRNQRWLCRTTPWAGPLLLESGLVWRDRERRHSLLAKGLSSLS